MDRKPFDKEEYVATVLGNRIGYSHPKYDVLRDDILFGMKQVEGRLEAAEKALKEIATKENNDIGDCFCAEIMRVIAKDYFKGGGDA